MKKETIKEVELLEGIQQELEEFKKEHKDFYLELQSLVDRYNEAREMAYKAVSAKMVSCGPFKLMGKPAVRYNVEKVLELFGEEFFLEYGGTIRQVPTYEMDRHKMDIACASGILQESEVRSIRTVQARYHQPPKLVLP